jgi:hypothetical protein
MNEKVVQICGPGVPGLEHCPAFYHFDLDPDELQAFFADPVKTLKELGLPYSNPNIVLWHWGEEWSETEGSWVTTTDPKPRGGCCVNTDGGVVCCPNRPK